MAEKIKLTSLSKASGCAAKIGPGILAKVLEKLPKPTDPKPTDPKPTQDDDKTSLGDVNEDGKITILDVIAINKSLMVGEKLSAQAKINANVDKKGDNPDEIDSLNILKYVVEIIADFSEIQ